MDRETFAELRQIAARKRDSVITEARDDYKRSITEIARLEQHLIGEIRAERPKRHNKRKLQDLIVAILPGDCSFTINDVCGFIEGADPDRTFNKQTVRMVLHRLHKEGTITRLSDASGSRRVIYAVPGFIAPADPSLGDWAKRILGESGKPMKAVEIMVAMTEAGYEMECSPKDAVHHLEGALVKDGVFIAESDHWHLEETPNESAQETD